VACQVPSDRFVGVDGAGERDAVAESPAPVCGDGIMQGDEACDDGRLNGSRTDACDSSCRLACGNTVVEQAKGEQCDLGPADSADCNSAEAGTLGCKAAKCGDGYTNMAAGEACDAGPDDTRICNGSTASVVAVRCKTATCGDGYVNVAASESCEPPDGNDSSTCNGEDAGLASCHVARCGDGHLNAAAGEQCDNGDVDTTTCNGSTAPLSLVRCKPAVW